jgi:hypothetical protein
MATKQIYARKFAVRPVLPIPSLSQPASPVRRDGDAGLPPPGRPPRSQCRRAKAGTNSPVLVVCRQCAATFIELVKKVAFVNEFRTTEEHPLGKVMNAGFFNDLRVVVVELDGAITGRIVVSRF